QNFYLQEAVKDGDEYRLKTAATIVENDQDKHWQKCKMPNRTPGPGTSCKTAEAPASAVLFCAVRHGLICKAREQGHPAADRVNFCQSSRGNGPTMLYLIEQCLNGIQLGMLMFLLAAGLTLIFGIMDLVNLAHGSLYMLGAYFAATFAALTDSFLAGIGLALLATLVAGMALEVIAIRPLYGRDHLDHVLGTFGLLLFFNELVRLIWGPAGLTLSLPPEMLTAVQILPGVYYPIYRLLIILATLAVALLLYSLVMRTRIGMLIRAGASNREMVGALGVNIKLLYTLVFGLGAGLAGFAGMIQAPLSFVQIGMGENILILAFVVIIIGGIGSIRGAFVAAIIVGIIDTIGRAFLPDLMRHFVSYSAGSSAGPALSSMLIYTLMAAVLVFRPEGLFPAAQR